MDTTHGNRQDDHGAPFLGGNREARGLWLPHSRMGGLIVVSSSSRPVTVMTRNLYVGADIERLVHTAATAQARGGTAEDVVVALANATEIARRIVDRTDFRVRARLIAGEVAGALPDLVGLQEVALWRSGPLRLDGPGVPSATTVDQDYLVILLEELAARGLDYRAAQVARRADVESPAFTGSPYDGTVRDARNVRLTVRDVILVRAGGDLAVTGSGDRLYADNLQVDIAGVALSFDRGFHWVDVRVGADAETRQLRFVNSHLEAFSADVTLAQARELLASTPTGLTTVLVCDANSDPLDTAGLPGDPTPSGAAYELITGAGGFTDAWLRWAPAEEGWTSGLSELLDASTGAGFTHRIDMVFVRTPDGGELEVDAGQVTGTRPADRDPATGLWPSDHGGVVLRLSGL